MKHDLEERVYALEVVFETFGASLKKVRADMDAKKPVEAWKAREEYVNDYKYGVPVSQHLAVEVHPLAARVRLHKNEVGQFWPCFPGECLRPDWPHAEFLQIEACPVQVAR